MTETALVVNKWKARRASEMRRTYPDICFTAQLDVLSMISRRDYTIRPHITRSSAVPDQPYIMPDTRGRGIGCHIFRHGAAHLGRATVNPA